MLILSLNKTTDREKGEGKGGRGKRKKRGLLRVVSVPVLEELSSPGVVVTSQTQDFLYLALSASLDISSFKKKKNRNLFLHHSRSNVSSLLD